jgi:hypothetical protein
VLAVVVLTVVVLTVVVLTLVVMTVVVLTVAVLAVVYGQWCTDSSGTDMIQGTISGLAVVWWGHGKA